MKNFLFHKIFAVVIYFTAAFLLFAQTVSGCSADYSIWQVRSKNADPLYRIIKDGKAGYIDQTGKIIVEPKLKFDGGNHGDEFRDGLLLTDLNGAYIDKTGKVVIEEKFQHNWNFSDGLAAAMKENRGKWGYIDRTGEFVISPRFETFPNGYVHSFSEGMAGINVKDKFGYIDRTGEFIIQPKFAHGEEFMEGLARVAVEGPCVYLRSDICLTGEIVGGKTNDQNVPSCKIAFINKSGVMISDERYENAGDFSEGLAAVLKDGKWGFINRKGQMVIPPQFDRTIIVDVAPVFSEGLALVKKGEFWGYIDKIGKFAIEPRFVSAGDFHDGLAVVGNSSDKDSFNHDDFYFINKKGEQAFPETFLLASHFFKGLAHVKLKTEESKKDDANYTYKGTFAYINRKGEKVFVYERSR